MKRLLLASTNKWASIARLPSTFGPSGFEVHALVKGDSPLAASSWLTSRTVVKGSIENLVARLLDMAGDYDRVIACDENVLLALLSSADTRVDALLPAPRDAMRALMDKTLFPDAARAGGVRVPRSCVAARADEVAEAVRDLGTPVVIKGTVGVGGFAVRGADDAEAAIEAAIGLGFPVLVEEMVRGTVGLMPCLFERGVLVAALAAAKVRTARPFGPSTISGPVRVDDMKRAALERAGRVFGLHGFVSLDYFEAQDGGEPIFIEINPRPVPQLHLGRRVGADMAAALNDALDGGVSGEPRLAGQGRDVVLFPQELHRRVLEGGRARGTVRWLLTPGALVDIPWNDMALVRRHVSRLD